MKKLLIFNSQFFWSLLILLALVVVITLTRFHTYNEPIERDIAAYAVIAHELGQGRLLYSDLWDHKPPAIHVTFALADKLVGYGQGEIYFLGLLAALLTLLGVYQAGSAGGLGLPGGGWAAAIWSIISADMMLLANQPNVEVFLNVLLIWVFVLLVSSEPKASRVNFAGILLAIGSLYKPQVAVFAFLFSIAAIFFPEGERRCLYALKIFFRLILPCLITWICCFFYFDLTHRATDFYDAIVVYNRYYGGHLHSNLNSGLWLKNLFPSYMWFLTPVILVVLGAFLLSYHQFSRSWIFLGAYIVGTYISVSAPGKFFPHYYQLWLPVVSVGGGWGAALIGEWLKSFKKIFYFGPGIVCLGLLTCHELPYYSLDADNWSIQKYKSDRFVKAEQLGHILSQILNPRQSFCSLGNETSLYFYSRKSPPTGIVFISPTVEGPLASSLTSRLSSDLTASKPDVIILDPAIFPDNLKPFLSCYHFWKSYPEDKWFKILLADNVKLKEDRDYFQK